MALLHIDDNPDDRALVELAIQRSDTNFTLYTADGAQSAKPHFDHHPQGAGPNLFPRPDLILLDFEMGEHTGADFLIWLRVVRKMTAIPVVMFSGSAGAGHVEECYQAGANHFVSKPAAFAAIEAIVRALHLCMSFNPPRFGPLSRLPEYEPDPRAADETA